MLSRSITCAIVSCLPAGKIRDSVSASSCCHPMAIKEERAPGVSTTASLSFALLRRSLRNFGSAGLTAILRVSFPNISRLSMLWTCRKSTFCTVVYPFCKPTPATVQWQNGRGPVLV